MPTLYTAIYNHPKAQSVDLSSIKICVSGGASLPLEVKAKFEAATGCKLMEGYGLSETAPVLTINPLDAARAGSAGLPVPGTIIEIASTEDSLTVLAQGERGEICARGPQVMPGYWHKPDETAHVMAGGRFHTGDVGYLDADGYLFIVDRIKDIIIACGYKIYPRLIEEAIYKHPKVAQAIVIGVPDPYRGQTVKAVVQPRAGETIDRGRAAGFPEGQSLADRAPARHRVPRRAADDADRQARQEGAVGGGRRRATN